MLLEDDTDVRDALAPLREATPALAAPRIEAERARRPRRALALAAVTAVAAAAIAALPGSGERHPQSAAALLRATAAVAADQPPPPAWAGYRYVKSIDRWTTQPVGDGSPPRPVGAPYTVEQTEEVWVDKDWQGRRIAPAGKLVAGTIPHGWNEYFLRPHDTAYMYGDGPLGKVPLSELPTDSTRLYDLLLAAYRDLRWSPHETHWAQGRPSDAQTSYELLREVLLLLSEANVTADQRAALIGVLARYDGVTPIAGARDHAGREGAGVQIVVRPDTGQAPTTFRILFDPDTSELLEWSDPTQVHTFVAAGHVAAVGDRP